MALAMHPTPGPRGHPEPGSSTGIDQWLSSDPGRSARQAAVAAWPRPCARCAVRAARAGMAATGYARRTTFRARRSPGAAGLRRVSDLRERLSSR
jgi:hypothetical protein